MRNIYIVNNSSVASQYGVGTYVEQLTKVVRERADLNLTIVQICANVENIEMRTNNGIRQFLIPSVDVQDNSFLYERYCRNISYILQEYIDLFNINVFHLNFYQDVAIVRSLRSRQIRCVVCFTVHYLNWCFVLKGNRTYFHFILSQDATKRSLKEIDVFDAFTVEKEMFNYVDYVICLSKSTKEILINDYQVPIAKLKYIANGLPHKLSVQDNECEKEPVLGKKEILILFVGRLDHNKGIEELLRAFRIVQDKIQNVRLVIVGDGEFATYLKLCERIWHKVSFVGRVEKDKLDCIYSMADLGVIASYTEQCSYVMIEMMMRGIPLVATSVAGVNEMVGPSYPFRVNISQEEICSINVEILAQQMITALSLNLLEKKSVKDYLVNRYIQLYGFDLFRNKMLDFYLNIKSK